MTDETALEAINQMIRRDQEATARAKEVYAALKVTRRLNDHRMVTFRCEARRCLLLDLVQTPAGVIVHQPRFKNSPGANVERSNEDGRRVNTEDGDRRWKSKTYPIEVAANFVMHCDHVLAQVIEMDEVERHVEAKTREVLIRG